MRCHDIKILNILKLHQLFVNSLINFCTKGLLLTSFPKCYFLRKSDKDDTADATIIIILSQSKWGMIRMVCPKKQNRASSLASFSFLFGLFKQTLKIYVKNVHPVSIGGIWKRSFTISSSAGFRPWFYSQICNALAHVVPLDIYLINAT